MAVNDDGHRLTWGPSLNARVVTADGSIADWTMPDVDVKRLNNGQQFQVAWACP